MAPRLDEKEVSKMLRRTPDLRTLTFCKPRTLEAHLSEISVFQICLGESVCAHLYLSPSTYTIVWNGTDEFQPSQPFMFVDLQFSNKPVQKLQILDNALPRKHDLSHFRFRSSKATVMLEDESDIREYTLTEEEDQERYVREVLTEPTVVGKVVFARYDSNIINADEEFYFGFTAERSDLSSSWEFAIQIPRNLLLKERILKWIAKDPSMISKSHEVDFKNSLNSLHKLVAA